MAYETGTASNYADLVDKIKTFCVANGWTLMREQTVDTTEKEIILKSASFNERYCYIGVRSWLNSSTYKTLDEGAFTDPSLHRGIVFNAYTDYTGGTFHGNTNPAVSSTGANYVGMVYDSNPSIDYRISTNGKCFILDTISATAWIKGVFYCGFFKCFGNITEYPNPIIISGANFDGGTVRNSFPSFSHSTYGHEGILCTPDNSWVAVSIFNQNNKISTTPNYVVNPSNSTAEQINSESDSLVICKKVYLFRYDSANADNNVLYGEAFDSLYAINKTMANGDTVSVSGKEYTCVGKNATANRVSFLVRSN